MSNVDTDSSKLSKIKKAMKGESSFADTVAGIHLSNELKDKIQSIYKEATEDRNVLTNIDDSTILNIFKNSVNNRYDTLKEISDAIDLDKEKVETAKKIKELKTDMDKMVSSNEDSRRELMEHRIVDKANEMPEDSDERKKLLALSKAYTDSYTLKPLMEYLASDKFNPRGFRKAMKRYKRYFADFDYAIQHSSNAVSITSLDNVFKYMRMSRTEKKISVRFEDDEPMLYCLILAMYCDSKKSDRTMVWFMYSCITSMMHILSSANMTPFIEEKLNYLNDFFEKARKVISSSEPLLS